MDTLITASDDALVPSQDDSAPASPASSFDALPAPLRRALEGRGYTELTAVQQAVIDAGLGERDLQISSQTGSGKTVALGFVLAAGLLEEAEASQREGYGPEALIIVPTRELANQVCEELGWLLAELPNCQVTSVTGGTPVYRDRQTLSRRPRILVGTPGRLLDHIRTRVLDVSGVRELVLDEADQMLDMGFREELEGILDGTPATRRTHLVSATFPEGIRRLTASYQRDPVSIEGTRLGESNKDIEHVGHLVDNRERYAALVNLLLETDGERTLVFVERRSDAVEVATMLEGDGFAAMPLSGELVQSQRERTLAAFRAGRASVLVATDVAARGLDVPDVATVIHTAAPLDSEVYTHRSGRTGRAGKAGRSVLITSPNRKRRVARLLSDAGVQLKWLPVPSAQQVRDNLANRARQRLETELDSTLAEGAPEHHLAQAAELLATREAAPLVAALLARLEPADRAQPKDIQAHEAPSPAWVDKRKLQRGRSDGPSSYRNDGPSTYRREAPARVQRDGRELRDHRDHDNSVRFFINRGTNQGATPSRILASVCRRGEVNGSDIGSIAVHPNASTFDVHKSVAERFEQLAGRRDPRDPQTLIRLDRGPKPTQRYARR